MRDDWEKLSDEKSSLRACRRRIPNRSRVVSCESRIVHMFYYLCLYSLHLLHRTLYRRTHSLLLRFKCIYHLSTMFCNQYIQQPDACTSGKRQFFLHIRWTIVWNREITIKKTIFVILKIANNKNLSTRSVFGPCFTPAHPIFIMSRNMKSLRSPIFPVSGSPFTPHGIFRNFGNSPKIEITS